MPIQSSELNFLSPNGFKFNLPKFPTLSLFVQSVNIPQISLNPAKIPTPFVSIPFPGDHIQYGPFSITFKVDDQLNNYYDLYQWFRGLAKVEDFTEAVALNQNSQNTINRNGPTSDAFITILDNQKNPTKTFNFHGIVPTGLSELYFSTTNVDVPYIACTCSFDYESFDITSN